MKKIGICTLYYNNFNYGANLQAYALCYTLRKLGYEPEVIAYYYSNKMRHLLARGKLALRKRSTLTKKIESRKKAIHAFNQSIPHSRLYYSNTINKANQKYGVFITGSDQVWNPDWINQYTSLSFVDDNKNTIAYAASTGKIHFTNEQKKVMEPVLSRTKHISIREKESIPALRILTDRNIEYVLDPTLLLTQNEWNTICSERIIEGNYMFCYFLGDNENLRKVAKEFAKKNELILVTLPYLNGIYRKVDDDFGDRQLFDVGPNDLLSIIRHSSFVMTDSFHVAVFAHIYNRSFLCSSECGNEMGCRFVSLTNLFDTEERYVPDHNLITVNKIMEIEQHPIKINYEKYEMLKIKSINFLTEALALD